MKDAPHAKRRGARLTAMRRASYLKIKEQIAKKGRSPLPPEPKLLDAKELIDPQDIPLPDANKHHADKYDPKYANFVAEMCRLGATDMEVARGLGVSLSVLWRWQAKYEDFFKAFLEGKDACDERVERSLYLRAVGYSYPAVKIFNNNGEPVVVPYIEHLPPDVSAQSRWLKSRKKDVWGDKQEVNLTGDKAFSEMWNAICTGQVLPLLGTDTLYSGGNSGNGEESEKT